MIVDGLWNWSIAATPAPTEVRAAVAEVLHRPVRALDDAADGAVLCDVWQVGGDFPTLVDCYLAPGGLDETEVAAAVAVRLGADLLLPDDTTNPSRYVHARPDGTLAAVHVDEVETDDGAERRHLRPCTGTDPACAAGPGCGRSRFPPVSPPPRPAAA